MSDRPGVSCGPMSVKFVNGSAYGEYVTQAVRVYAAINVGLARGEEAVLYTDDGRQVLIILPAGYRRMLAERSWALIIAGILLVAAAILVVLR